MEPAFKRILLKLSGEALVGSLNNGIDTKVAAAVAKEIKTVHDLGVEIAIVIGGGNIFRGVSESAGNMDRAAADYIGMLATVMNAVVLQDRYPAACRAVHSPACRQTFGEKARRYICGRNRKPVFHDRFGCGSASVRDRIRSYSQGNKGRWHLFCRSDEGSGGNKI